MRTCTLPTLDKLRRLRPSEDRPAWLRAAISDSMNGHAISLEREDRMCKALGIASPKRAPRRFYRPCLSVELGEAIRKYGIDAEAMLWLFVKWEIAAAEVEANPDAHEHGYAVELEL